MGSLDSGDLALITALATVFVTLIGGFLTFRGGMPAAADKMSKAFSDLNDELIAEMDRRDKRYHLELETLRLQHQAELAKSKRELEELKERVIVLEVNNRILQGEFNRETYRSQYFRNGAFRLWYQLNDLKTRRSQMADIEPAFDPNLDKYPPRGERKLDGQDQEASSDQDD